MSCIHCKIPLDFDFTFAFQPIVDIKQNTIFAHEALVRGIHQESALEVLAHVTDTLRYSFDQKCRYRAIELISQLDPSATVSINFMPRAVYDPNVCIATTLEASETFHFPIEQIIFEVSEQEKADDFSHILSIFEAYKKMGFKTAIDDFGAGYSGLNFLAAFVPDLIKLDMMLIRDCHQSKKAQIILKHISYMCRELGTDIIAEGVEKAEELDFLTSIGISKVQGFYFERPMFKKLSTYPKVL